MRHVSHNQFLISPNQEEPPPPPSRTKSKKQTPFASECFFAGVLGDLGDLANTCLEKVMTGHIIWRPYASVQIQHGGSVPQYPPCAAAGTVVTNNVPGCEAIPESVLQFVRFRPYPHPAVSSSQSYGPSGLSQLSFVRTFC